MDLFETLISTVDRLLDSNRKRHITGGVLISLSLLFGGLAATVMTIKEDDDE